MEHHMQLGNIVKKIGDRVKPPRINYQVAIIKFEDNSKNQFITIVHGYDIMHSARHLTNPVIEACYSWILPEEWCSYLINRCSEHLINYDIGTRSMRGESTKCYSSNSLEHVHEVLVNLIHDVEQNYKLINES